MWDIKGGDANCKGEIEFFYLNNVGYKIQYSSCNSTNFWFYLNNVGDTETRVIQKELVAITTSSF